LFEFQQKVGRLQGAVTGAVETLNELKSHLASIRRALQQTTAADPKLYDETDSIEKRANEILRALRGEQELGERQENLPPAIVERVNTIVGDQRMSTARPAQAQREHYAAAAREFEKALSHLRTVMDGDVARLEKAMQAAGALWTPGRVPDWKDN